MKKDCPSPYREFIEKPEISFWMPIIFTAVSITISFMALSSKVELLTQKMETVIANQEQILNKYENVQVRLGTAENKITYLDTNQKLVLRNLGID